MGSKTALAALLEQKEGQSMTSPFATPHERLVWLAESYGGGTIDTLECELHLADMEQVVDDWKSGLSSIRIPPNLFPELKDQFANTYQGLDSLKNAIAEFRQFLASNDPTHEHQALLQAQEAQHYFEVALETAHQLLANYPAA